MLQLLPRHQEATHSFQYPNQHPTVIGVDWDGLPFYAARMIRRAIDDAPAPVCVVSIGEPPQPRHVIEAALGQDVRWNGDRDSAIGWQQLAGRVPAVAITSGWRCEASLRLAREVRQHGGVTCLMADNPWRGTLRQHVGRMIFGRSLRDLFTYAWVPGRAAIPLMRYLGFAEDRILTGLYGADPAIFTPGPALAERPKQFVFVGRLVRQKAVDILEKAFVGSRAAAEGWRLAIIGDGPLRKHRSPRGIQWVGSQDPHCVAHWLRLSRCLVLPSRMENWGVVVHEASSAGCAILVSQAVGAQCDLVSDENGLVVPPRSVAALRAAMDAMSRWSPERWTAAGEKSRELAGQFGPETWRRQFQTLCNAAKPFRTPSGEPTQSGRSPSATIHRGLPDVAGSPGGAFGTGSGRPRHMAEAFLAR